MRSINIIFLCIYALIACNYAKREPRFAPYLFMGRSQDVHLVQYKQQTGISGFTLAFALAGGGACNPMWDGTIPIDEPNLVNELKAFKAAGGNYIVATGGAAGVYLENACGSAANLQAAYKKILDVTGATGLDIDVEATIPVDTVMEALAGLQRQNPSITVSFTLRVIGDDYGVTDLNVIQSAAKHGVDVDAVNPMAMDFGKSPKSKTWGDAVVNTGDSVVRQMKTIWPQKSDPELYSMLGITPMIGLNDVGMIFELDHARQLVKYAIDKGVGHLAFWSINRDKPCSAGGPVFADPGCSSIPQQVLEFTKIFMEYDRHNHTDPTPGPTPPPGPTPDPHTKTPVPTSPPGPTTPFTMDCTETGRQYPDMNDCSVYYVCDHQKPVREVCSPGELYNTDSKNCDYADKVKTIRPECR
ncbi:chitinase-like [Oppia nitens]|uniref:chitinase-like n=1 Tax=Oppia nitens TaxID=1686743 RepID=UPI0023DA83A9|nr:chitinase-like [Oppia nitens]